MNKKFLCTQCKFNDATTPHPLKDIRASIKQVCGDCWLRLTLGFISGKVEHVSTHKIRF